jgi:tight adherence protein B
MSITGAGLGTAWVTSGPGAVAALLAVLAGLAAQGALRDRLARRRGRLVQLPAALDRLAAALRTGTSLPAALHEVGAGLDPPIGPELMALGRQAAHGQPVSDVLDRWAAVHDDAGTRLAASALVLATVIGSAPARAVDGVATTIRERLDLGAERRALGAQARASGLVLSLAPLAFAGVLVLADTAAARFLLRTPGGWACLTLGIGLDAVGAWWMSRLTRSVER